MARREPDIDRITTLLGQCLGRIDEQAYRLQRSDDDEEDTDADAGDVLEKEAALLQELVGTLLHRAASPDRADLNRIVAAAVQSCLGEVSFPVVVRQRLEPDLPPIAARPGQLAFAVQRALVIALGRAAAGHEIVVTTRRDHDDVVLELESRGTSRDRHLQERSTTLCEFVAGFRGHCRVEDVHGSLCIVLELPPALALDEY